MDKSQAGGDSTHLGDESSKMEPVGMSRANFLALDEDPDSELSSAAPTPNSTSAPPDPILPTTTLNQHSGTTSFPTSTTTMPDSTSHKPLSRRSSQFHSSRPAPPSPAPSRRTSQINSPALSSRERASSTSSSAGHMSNAPSASATPALGSGSAGGLGRKLSQSQGAGLTGRNSISKNRPRSSLGTAMYTGGITEDGSAVTGEKDKKDRPPQSHSAPSPHQSQSASLSSGAETPAKSTLRSESAQISTASPIADTPAESETPGSSSISPTNTSPTKSPGGKASCGSVVIRDYGFPPSDERYHGRGQPTPAAESSSSTRLSSFLASSASPSERRSPSMSDNKRDKEKGWSFSMLSWRGFIGRRSRSNSRSEAGGVPGAGQGGRSLDAESEPDLLVSGVGGAEDDYAFESSSEDDEEPFGLYRAVYPFEAEGEHEISLEEDEVVEVKGRGGGEGWVIAVKLKRSGQDGQADEGGGSGGGKDMVEGLVPEGYLEKVNEEELRSGMIHAGFQGGQRRAVAPGGISEEPEETSDLETGAGL